MKNIFLAIGLIFCFDVSAQEALPKLKIKEVKAFVETVNPDTTCIDEYLHRRKQLITKLALSPALAAGGAVAGFYVGGYAGVGLAHVTNVTESWAALGYVVGGAFMGGAASIIAVGVDTTVGGVTLANNLLITKAVAEQYLNREGHYTEKLYKKYLKHSKVDLARDEFIAKLMTLDADGKLCDGSLVKQPRIKLGPKLKYKVAKLKDLVRGID